MINYFFQIVKRYKDCHIGKWGPIQPPDYPFAGSLLLYNRRVKQLNMLRITRNRYKNGLARNTPTSINSLSIIPLEQTELIHEKHKKEFLPIKYISSYTKKPIHAYCNMNTYYDSRSVREVQDVDSDKQKRMLQSTYYYINKKGDK
jgi:hypothetical protein